LLYIILASSHLLEYCRLSIINTLIIQLYLNSRLFALIERMETYYSLFEHPFIIIALSMYSSKYGYRDNQFANS